MTPIRETAAVQRLMNYSHVPLRRIAILGGTIGIFAVLLAWSRRFGTDPAGEPRRESRRRSRPGPRPAANAPKPAPSDKTSNESPQATSTDNEPADDSSDNVDSDSKTEAFVQGKAVPPIVMSLDEFEQEPSVTVYDVVPAPKLVRRHHHH